MVNTVPDILARIVEHKKLELRDQRDTRSHLETLAEDRISDRRDFAGALRSKSPSIIAEIKKASPSKGVLSENFEPPSIARHYESGGAAALSVLTDERFFQGSLQDLQTARASVTIPVLRKDFTTDPYHVVQAAAHGADAILLIASILSVRELQSLRELAAQYRLPSLVEVHDSAELERALDSGAEIIGVNNRDLHTFKVSLTTSLELVSSIPESILKISESGIETRAQVLELTKAGFQSFLVGEHLMKSDDPSAALRDLLP